MEVRDGSAVGFQACVSDKAAWMPSLKVLQGREVLHLREASKRVGHI